jgi:hypothetical protein
MPLTARCHARSRGHPVAQNDPICIVGPDSNKIGEAAHIGGYLLADRGPAPIAERDPT